MSDALATTADLMRDKQAMTDIWIVTSGDYSSYGVDAAFSTIEAADAWAARMNANRTSEFECSYNVERIDLDPPLLPLVEKVVEQEEPPKPVRQPMTPEERQKLIDSLILDRRGI